MQYAKHICLFCTSYFTLYKEIYFLKLFNNWLESAREDLMDMFSVHTVEEIVVRNMY